MPLQNIWLTLTVWGLIYLADYYLTIFSAAKIRGPMQAYVRYEGSYELTPEFQKDVDKLRLFSPQFLIRWLLSLPLIYLMWWLSVVELENPAFFEFLVGALILREIVVHLRHARNLFQFFLTKRGGLTGRLEYRRWLVLKISSAEIFSFGVMYLFLAFFLQSWFFGGGVFGCWIVAVQHWRLAGKTVKASRGIDGQNLSKELNYDER